MATDPWLAVVTEVPGSEDVAAFMGLEESEIVLLVVELDAVPVFPG